MRINSRLDRLERAAAGRGCPDCGSGGPARVVVIPPPVFRTLREIRPGQPPEETGDRCPRCRRLTVLRLGPPPAATESL